MTAKPAALLAKAERTIASAEHLLDAGDIDGAAGRAYYAMFYVAEALLIERGLEFSKHSGVQAALGQHFVKSGQLDARFHRWLIEAFGRRLVADYDVDEVLDPEQVRASIGNAREFLAEGRRKLGL